MDNNGNRRNGDVPVSPEQLRESDEPIRPQGDWPERIQPTEDRRMRHTADYRRRMAHCRREDQDAVIERYVPVTIFLEDGTNSDVVERAVERLLRVLKISIEAADEPKRGSWFRRLLGKTQQPMSGYDLDGVFESARQLIENSITGGDPSEQNIQVIAAVELLLRSISDEVGFAIHLGSFVMLRFRDNEGISQVVVQPLSLRQAVYLCDHPEIMKSPAKVLDALAVISGQDVPLPFPDRRRNKSWTGSLQQDS